MFKENDGFKVEANIGKGCKLNATVTVSPAQVKKAYKQAVKEINKEVSLPGFRKGKAPEETIIKQYSAPIDREWKEIVVNDAFQAALKLTSIYPYNKNTIDKPKIETCSLDDGALVSISYECYPEVPQVKFDEIKLPHIDKKEVSDQEVEEILKEIKQAHATWEEISDRPVKEGDYVDLTIHKIDEDPSHALVQNRRFEVSPVMISWLKKMVLDQTAGASIDGTTFPDEKASDEEKKAYEPIAVRVTLHKIQKIILPEVDDALAHKTGATDKEDLLMKIRANLGRDALLMQKEEKIRALENILIQKYKFEVPASLLKNEIESRKNEKTEELRRQNMSPEKIEAEKESIDTWATNIAEQSLRLHFLLAAIGEKGKVEMSREELNEKLNNEILRNPYYHSLVKENNEKLQGLIRRLTTQFQHEKIREYALEQVEAA